MDDDFCEQRSLSPRVNWVLRARTRVCLSQRRDKRFERMPAASRKMTSPEIACAARDIKARGANERIEEGISKNQNAGKVRQRPIIIPYRTHTGTSPYYTQSRLTFFRIFFFRSALCFCHSSLLNAPNEVIVRRHERKHNTPRHNASRVPRVHCTGCPG